MVQNSLGRMWLATYPDSPLRQKMEYYIEPAEQTEDVQAQLKAITPASLDPESLTFLDPAGGSGHILVEAYDIFKEIYLERGYSSRDFPRLILEKNLYGLDIDDRAAQMAGFALLMKARKDDRRILQNGNAPRLNVMAIQGSDSLDAQGIAGNLLDRTTEVGKQDITELVELFRYGKTFGSLITVPEYLAEKLSALTDIVDAKLRSGDMFAQQTAEAILPFVKQAKMLAGKYDCVVANPPYMGSRYYDSLMKSFADANYKFAKGDLYTCFMVRNAWFAKYGGLIGMITIPNWMFLSTFEGLRQWLFREAAIDTFCHNGRGVFGSDFGSCAFTFRHQALADYKGCFKRLFARSGSVASNEELNNRFGNAVPFVASAADFHKIPGSPVAYWISDKIRDIFAASRLMGEVVEAKQGLATADNDRFLRRWHEVDCRSIGFCMANRIEAKQSNRKWFPHQKGGDFRKWYGNHEFVVNWQNDGQELKSFEGSVIRNPSYYFKECVSWSDVTSAANAFRWDGVGFIPNVIAPVIFRRDIDLRLFLLAGNNSFYNYVSKVLNPSIHFHVGYFSVLPFPEKLVQWDLSIADKLVTIAKADWDSFETSWDFHSFPWLTSPLKSATIAESWQNWVIHCTAQIKRMQELETENNRLFIEAYGLQDELIPEVPEDQITLARADRGADMKRLISYAIGCMMGRYSFDQPGLVYAQSGNEDFDESKYECFPADDDGIIPVMDMEWLPDDATGRFEEFLKVAWAPETLEENLKFIADSLSPKGGETPRETIRRYISRQFFKDHLQTYKKRPIYWLFSSGKQRAFECLVYLHRYNEATLSRMRNEYVTPLQGKLSARMDYLTNEIDAAATTSARNKLQKQLEILKKKQAELSAFDDLLRHHADRRISLDLDDGVKVNYGKFGNLLAEVKTITGSDE